MIDLRKKHTICPLCSSTLNRESSYEGVCVKCELHYHHFDTIKRGVVCNDRFYMSHDFKANDPDVSVVEKRTIYKPLFTIPGHIIERKHFDMLEKLLLL